MENRAIYLDYNSTTPVDARVLDAMMPALTAQFGNPSSAGHESGRTARGMVEGAREKVAGIVNMRPADVIFTSGATESINLALIGTMNGHDDIGDHIITCTTEHKAVLDTVRHLEDAGKTATYVPVDSDGVVNLETLRGAITDRTAMISIMAANSETGVIHPMDEIVRIAHERDVLVHCDATQAVGKIPFDAGSMGLDMVSFSSHKIYGPKGCGALVATRQARRQIRGIVHGGGQEENLRSGTLNVPGIVGFGTACGIAAGLDTVKQEETRNYLEKRVCEAIPGITINGKGAPRLPNTSNMRIAGAIADAILVNAPGIEIATGSACTSSAIEPSHVLVAMGIGSDAADESIRVSLGRDTTQQDIDTAVSELARAAQFVRGKEVEVRN